jgi:hypothetical protein
MKLSRDPGPPRISFNARIKEDSSIKNPCPKHGEKKKKNNPKNKKGIDLNIKKGKHFTGKKTM